MGVATAADETTDGANTTQKQAAALNDISRRLENLVGLSSTKVVDAVSGYA